MGYKPVIGLEIHVELLTNTKAFCGCPNTYGLNPNTNVCPTCLGLPGTLPVLNEKVVEQAIKASLYLNCTIDQNSSFDRKNYTYPDLVKGYQITQYYHPIACGGYLDIMVDGREKRISINRIHIEEDVGKTVYKDGDIFLDFNRSGVPLIEIVTEPNFTSSKEVIQFLKQLREILIHGGISDCKLEQGSMRVDVNTSISLEGLTGKKTEIKNLNSFKNIEMAIHEEIKRQMALLNEGKSIKEQTLKWDDKLNKLSVMRDKASSDEYMYFPEYDLPPIHIDHYYLQRIKEALPKKPSEIKGELREMGLRDEQVQALMNDKELLKYYKECISIYNMPERIFNYLKGDVTHLLKERNLDSGQIPIEPYRISELSKLVEGEKVHPVAAKRILREMFETKEPPKIIAEKLNLLGIDDSSAIKTTIEQILQNHPQAVKDYIKGKHKALGFIMGVIMEHTRGRINPQMAREITIQLIKSKDKGI